MLFFSTPVSQAWIFPKICHCQFPFSYVTKKCHFWPGNFFIDSWIWMKTSLFEDFFEAFRFVRFFRRHFTNWKVSFFAFSIVKPFVFLCKQVFNISKYLSLWSCRCVCTRQIDLITTKKWILVPLSDVLIETVKDKLFV